MFGVRLVVKSAVGQRSAGAFMEEQEQQRDLHTLGSEVVGVAAALAFQRAMAFKLP
jgi:hypothetical protein